MNKHSDAWLDGYNCRGPKIKNPYIVGQPWLAEFPDMDILRKMREWEAGWECRFHGEKP